MRKAARILLAVFCCATAACLLQAFRKPSFPVLADPGELTVYVLDEEMEVERIRKKPSKRTYFQGYPVRMKLEIPDASQRKSIVAALNAGSDDIDVRKFPQVPRLGVRAVEGGLSVDYLVSFQFRCVYAYVHDQVAARTLTSEAEHALKY